jgi:hypothetical protein
MVQITGITSSPSQKFFIPEPSTRKNISFTLRFSARANCWFFDIEYQGKVARGIKLVRGPNILTRNKNTLPFGLCVTVADNYEPFLINDFSSERVKLFLLTSDEVQEVDDMIVAGETVP